MKLVIFGDSFSCEFSKINKDYIEWKKYEPKNFGQIISENLNIECVNFANGGWDNYSIFHSIFNFIRNNKIDDDDIIIIGWTNISRYRVASIYDFWIPITPHTIYNFDKKRVTEISDDALFEFCYNRTSYLYYQEVNDFIECVNRMFPNNIIINWTWDCENKLDTIPYFQFDSIYDETNGEIDDKHINEKSAQQFSNILLKYIENLKVEIDEDCEYYFDFEEDFKENEPELEEIETVEIEITQKRKLI